jgi:hypothetical protein
MKKKQIPPLALMRITHDSGATLNTSLNQRENREVSVYSATHREVSLPLMYKN